MRAITAALRDVHLDGDVVDLLREPPDGADLIELSDGGLGQCLRFLRKGRCNFALAFVQLVELYRYFGPGEGGALSSHADQVYAYPRCKEKHAGGRRLALQGR